MRTTGITLTLAAAGLLAACADGGQGGGQQGAEARAQQSFLADRADPCFPEREALEANGTRIESPVQGLLDAGYAIGGVLDSIRQTGRASGTITSSGVTVAGGYIEALRQENGTVLAMVEDATRDIEEENRRIDALVSAFEQLAACRKAGGEAIRADYQAGKITREDGAAGMIALRGAYRADIARVRALLEQVSRNTETYAQVYNDIAEDNDADAIELGPYRKPVFDAGRASARVVKKRARVERAAPKGTLRAEAPAPQVKPRVQQMQNQVLTNVRKRDTLINRIETAETETEELDLALWWHPRAIRPA